MARSLASLQLYLVVAAMTMIASAAEAQYQDDSVGTAFFLTEDLRPGSKMTLHFAHPGAGAITLPRARARARADSIQFTPAKLPEILARLSVPAGSAAAAAIRSTLAQCKAPPQPGVETLRCVTSYDSMADFAAASLGTRGVRAAATRLGAPAPRQAYVMQSVKTVAAPGGDMVACHRVPYSNDVFACHTTTAAVYAVGLAGADGTRGQALAACHADAFPGISEQAYEKLGVKPDSGVPVCHFLPQDSMLWMRK